ncbi:MCP four helix bundle domain-containing protein [Curvibacter sp. CHRR-16]|uniref:methyl-accepting chemotaxis protein n=1 Tax=Curvibacter sp. CHRR-16 TaxID=2835872 RepID=UPI001BDB5443|nr:methyl-accepting chemotaxis protein [Curvibacter sp. CHRR-16]MBT0570277.1 MCP four helix bundle domain-containing protein [Curvibacter sp. CHRR-16]
MADLKLSTQLKLAFGLLTALLVVVVSVALLQMRSMNSNVEDISGNWLPRSINQGEWKAQAAIYRIQVGQHAMTNADNLMEAADKAAVEALQKAQKLQADFEKLVKTDEEKALFATVKQDFVNFQNVHQETLKLSKGLEKLPAKNMFDKDGRPAFEKLMTSMGTLSNLISSGANRASDQASSSFFTARATMLVVLALSVGIAFISSFWLIRVITRPIHTAVETANSIAKGDLSQQIAVDSRNEIGQLQHALASMQTHLREVVSKVRTGSESVATASAEIAQGNQDLSMRTEQQANALQLTTSSMSTLGDTVRTTAHNASTANDLAQHASGIAKHGGKVVNDVIQTMRGIDDASQKIANIIGVIDGIAFQTNILALNAAVEAARAGEQGRGFAVVASEVRTLASRSAEAAKEIKGLIATSVERVEQGSRLVDDAGKTMEDVVTSIERVTHIIGDISAASTTQTGDVSSIGDSINNMDHTTQQNAALVEEIAAAASSLKNQAAELVEVVSLFVLADSEHKHSQQGAFLTLAQ